MSTKYEVIPEYYKPWFRKGRIVYKLFKTYKYWDDPTYGNGGGDYRDATVLVTTFDDEQEAIGAMNTLNKDYK